MNTFIIFLGAIALSVALSALLALPVMWLWGATMPAIFGLKALTFGQAWCLQLLCALLFKSPSVEGSK